MELVSIIVPIYNMEEFLPRCLESLLRQTYSNIEILLVNDGSTDSSGKICNDFEKAYPDKIKVIHKKNGGLSSARNTGMIYARGKYIIFPDPDDWTEPDYIQKGMMLLHEYEADCVCLGYYVEYENKSISVNSNAPLRCMDSNEAKRALLMPPAMYGFAWNKLYNLEIIRTHQLEFLDDVGTTEDLDFTFRYLAYCNKICFAPEERVYHYYQRFNAATHGKFSNKKVESIRTYEKMISNSNGDKKLIMVAENEICNTSINLIWLYKRDKFDDEQSWCTLRNYLKKYLKVYMKSNNYNVGRKLQALLAYFLPDLYVGLKNRVQKG